MKTIEGYFRVNECEEGYELAFYHAGFARPEDRVIIAVCNSELDALRLITEQRLTLELP